jgi:hypothetical protein
MTVGTMDVLVFLVRLVTVFILQDSYINRVLRRTVDAVGMNKQRAGGWLKIRQPFFTDRRIVLRILGFGWLYPRTAAPTFMLMIRLMRLGNIGLA